ncbi:hypothetical protein [Neptunomonas japonica]|uniref:hypothetical protein n=1 Tax=Neptunomonas japonica TaxID=417574 RepID=UPI0004194C13|nr:hypothetical protein [Neptunomonas japonica]
MAKYLSIVLLLCSGWVLAASGIKDPTQPYQSQNTPVSQDVDKKAVFNVTSILKKKKTAWAIINGAKASVGERVEGAKIMRIAYDKVLLDVGGSRRWVPLSNKSGLKKSR